MQLLTEGDQHIPNAMDMWFHTLVTLALECRCCPHLCSDKNVVLIPGVSTVR